MAARALSLNLTAGMRLVGTQSSRVPHSIDGAQVGVRSDYHKTQPAPRGGTRARARAASYSSGRAGINRSVHEPGGYDDSTVSLRSASLAFIEHFIFQKHWNIFIILFKKIK